MDDVLRSQEALAQGWQAGDVPANGIKLHYVRTGGDKPALLMAHGHSDNGLCWIRVARALEGEYDCIMYDARRHGLSEDGEEGAGRDAMVHDAAGLIEALGLERPGMIGHSMGAMCAAGVGALYPDLLRYIILEDVPWWDEETRQRWSRPRPQAAPQEQPTTREGWVARCRQQSPNWHEDEVQTWADSKMFYHSRPQPAGHPTVPPWQEIAQRISAPTLLLTGDPERGAIVTPAVAEEALRILKRGRAAHIAGAGHCIHRDQFEAAMAAIRGFLAEYGGA